MPKKEPLTYLAQIKLLKSRNLIIDNEEYALNFLRKVSYYRLSGYRFLFEEERGADLFIDGAKFDDLVQVYEFDRQLRFLVLDMIERIEVTLRTKLTYLHAHKYGKHGYSDPANFHSKFDHRKVFGDVLKELDRSQELFIESYKSRFGDTNVYWWMLTEVISFGRLSFIIKGLKPEDKTQIAREIYDLPNKPFEESIRCLVYVRNLCAHHSRLLDRKLAIAVRPFKKDTKWKTNGKTMFDVFMIFKHLQIEQSDFTEYIESFKELLNKYPLIQTKMLGFPENWQEILEIT